MNEKIINTVYVSVGAPGSGKSTWWEEGIRNQIIPQDQSVRINQDEIRKQLCGNESDQSKNSLVAKIAKQNLDAALSNRIPVIYWDNTSARPKYRKEVIKAAKLANYKIVAIYHDLPLEVVLSRNSMRDRIVPEDVVTRIYNNIKYNPPELNEGFDNIIYVKE